MELSSEATQQGMVAVAAAEVAADADARAWCGSCEVESGVILNGDLELVAEHRLGRILRQLQTARRKRTHTHTTRAHTHTHT